MAEMAEMQRWPRKATSGFLVLYFSSFGGDGETFPFGFGDVPFPAALHIHDLVSYPGIWGTLGTP